MKDDFLGVFIGNPNRAQLIRIFVFNPSEIVTLRTLAKRSGVSPQAAAHEVKALEKLGIVKKGRLAIALANGSKRLVKPKEQKEDAWILNGDFKHVRALSSFVHEVSPVRYDNIVGVLKRTGKVSAVILSGSFVGDPSRPADLIVATDSLNERRLETAIRGLEPTFGREIRYAAFSTPEFRYRITIQDRLLRDTLDFPHVVLLDRTRLL